MKQLKDLFNLKGKTALVTGGAGYLGNAICESLAELGATVIIASRDLEKCKNYAVKLNQLFPGNHIGFECDITNLESLKKLKKEIISATGGIDILINDAWSGNKNSLESITFEDWDYDINVCLNGPFYTTKVFLDELEKNKGVILNVASMYGVVAPDYKLYLDNDHANPPSYGAAKAGIIQLTKYLASFLGSKGVRVNCISPGPFPFKSTIDTIPDFINKLEQKNMLGRVGDPEDLKGIVALLCSDASGYITGQNISIDGGWTSW